MTDQQHEPAKPESVQQQQPQEQEKSQEQATPAEPEPVSPKWLPERLEQARASERKKLMQEFGVESPDALRQRLARAQELEDAQLSEQERTEKLLRELQPKAERVERLETLFASVVEAKFTGLSEQQQAAIDAVAAGNAEERWKIMSVMEAAGSLAAPPQQPKPANTAPQGQPPPDPAKPKTPYEIWQDKKASNSTEAALFYQLNSFAIENSR